MNICDIISKSNVTKSDIRKLIQKTYYTNKKENYGTICLHGDTASLENVGVGEREYISSEKLHYGCSGNAQKLAEIHTHPGRSLLMSEGDILDSFRRNVDVVCIAVETENKENNVGCHTIKNIHRKTRTYVDDLKKEIEQTVKQLRETSDKAFKTSYSNNIDLIRETNRKEKELQDKYWKKAKELHGLMDNSSDWFDYCEFKL